MDRIYCTQCGAENGGENRFCINCGAGIESRVRPGAAAGGAASGGTHERAEESGPDTSGGEAGHHAEGAQPWRDRAAEKTHAPEWKTCPRCGAVNDKWKVFCVSCGERVPEHSVKYGAGSPGGYHSGYGADRGWARPKDQPLPTDGIGEIVSKSFSIYTANFGLLFGSFWLLTIAAGAIGFFVSLISFVPVFPQILQGAAAALLVGMFVVCLSAMRGFRTDIGHAFNSLTEKYIPAMIAEVIIALINVAIAFFAFGPALYKTLYMKGPFDSGESDLEVLRLFSDFAAPLAVAIISYVIIAMLTLFVLPLIADRNIGFWHAIVASAKFVLSHFFEVLLVLILAGVIAVSGVIALIIGAFFTAPMQYVIIAAYYESRKHLFEV